MEIYFNIKCAGELSRCDPLIALVWYLYVQASHQTCYTLPRNLRKYLLNRIMCTKGSVGQVSADTIDRDIDRYVGRYSVDTRSIHRPSVDRVLTEYRSMQGQWYIGQLSVVYRYIGRYLADTTFSTHDPLNLMSRLFGSLFYARSNVYYRVNQQLDKRWPTRG